MGGLVNSILDTLSDIVDAVAGLVIKIWQEITVPILETIFSIFGIEDETVVTVQKVSVPVLLDSKISLEKSAIMNTVIGMQKNGAGFFDNYFENFYKHKARLRSYYKYAEKGPYVYGLPEMNVQGTNLDFAAVDFALNSAVGGSNTVLSANTTYARPEIWFKHDLQSSHGYIPYLDRLTAVANNGVSYDDWRFSHATFNTVDMDYDVVVKRTADLSHYWITGPKYCISGGSFQADIKLSRAVPTGSTFTVDITYEGATAGTHFNGPTSVVFSEGETLKTISITDVNVSAHKRLKVKVSTSDLSVYEAIIRPEAKSYVTVDLIAQSTHTLSTGHLTVSEGSSLEIEVSSINAPNSAFTVNWNTKDLGSAIPGVDFLESFGTLNFSGVEGEKRTITLSTFTDEDIEFAEVFALEFDLASTLQSEVIVTEQITDEPVATLGEDSLIIKKPNFALERYLIVQYHESSADPSEWFYWLYRLEDNTYANIDPTSSNITNLEMLPVAILRKNKQFIDQEKDVENELYEDFGKDTEVYRTTRGILSKLGIKVKDMIDSIAENPDIELIDDAFINFAMCPSDNNKILSKLLWMHFYEIVVVNGVSSNVDEYNATFEEQDVNNAMAWNNHFYEEALDISLGNIVDQSEFNKLEIGEFSHYAGAPNLVMIRKDSETTFSKITVENLAGMAAIAYDGYHNIAFTKVEDENFTIPVSWYVLSKLQGPEVLEVFPYIFRFDVYSIEVTEIAWYQTKAFKILVQIAVIIITVATGGTTSWLDVLVQVLFTVAVTEIAVFVAELTGNEYIAAAVAIIAAVVLGGFSSSSFDLTTLEGLTNTVTVFSASLSGAQEGVLNELQKDLDALIGEYEELKKEQEESGVYNQQSGGLDFIYTMTPDMQLYFGRDVQYDFDLLYDYNNFLYGVIESKLSAATI